MLSQGTYTSQHQLCESGQKWRLLKDTNNKKRLAWAKKHKQWTLDRWKSVLWSDESTFEIFGSNHCVFVRRRVGEWMISAFVVPPWSMEEVVWWCFALDTVCDLFIIQGMLDQHGYDSILQWYAIPSGLSHPTSRLCKCYLTKKESDGMLH